MIPLFLSLRPKQWTKNLVLFAGLLFSKNLLDSSLLFKTFLAFLLFCLLSSSVYLLNDIIDLEKDRRHPRKSKRPIASGRLSSKKAMGFSVAFATIGIVLSYLLDPSFGISALVFLLLMLLYIFLLKRVVILDVLAIALGFVLRAVAGALVIHVEISSWLLVCTILLALFLALSKRRHELVLFNVELTLKQVQGRNSELSLRTPQPPIPSRKGLAEYSPHLLDQMISVVSATLVMSYALYTMDPQTVEKFHTRGLAFTIPFVLYGIFRYLYLIYKREEGGTPETTLLQDKPLLANCGLWILAVGLILYF
ncbi:decaprenyl-phosphate phosphoribosyltransferase [candidate division TA06 bacterium]|nr:decaprenyl-phosphate phosphoribosyltransferase [candidate division TA06 bacterium]